MNKLCHAFAVMLLVTPTLALAQAERIGAKQKAWLTANFRTGLSDCTIASGKQGFALSGTGVASFDDSHDDGLDFAVSTAGGGPPTVTALAIKTKGTSAQRQRAIDAVCEVAAAADGKAGGGLNATCAVSGDPDSPEVRFIVPLAAFGDAGSVKSYVGTVTIVKSAADIAASAHFLSKKGYDYYKAQSNGAARANAVQPIEMTVVAACDISGLSAKVGQPVAHYDLAVGKKA